MKSAFLFLVFTILCFAVPCLAQSSDVDGNQLLEHCTAYQKARDNPPLTVKEQVSAGFCLGYMSAIADSNAENQHFCAPGNATIEQLARIVLKWLKENPEKLHLNAGVISYTALRAAFPCH